MNFDQYLSEGVSEEDIKKAKEVGMKTAKEVFKDDFDEEKAKKMIDDIVKKHKDKAKDGEDLAGIIANSFRG